MDITKYLSNAIENIIQNAVRASLKNPRESAFLTKYIIACKKAITLRNNFEKEGKHIPPFLICSITTNCNLHCIGCYARANKACGEDLDIKELSCDKWDSLFKEASDIGVSFILLAGGEPLIRKDIIEKASSNKKIIFPIFTNGTLIDDQYIELFNKNRNLVPVLSIEGNKQQTDARRGEGTNKSLSLAMDKLNNYKIFYGVSITVTTENLGTVTDKEYINNLYNNGLKILFYIEYVPVDNSTIKLAFGDKERKFLAKKQDELRKLYPNMIFISFPGDEKSTDGCLAAGRGFFHINATGDAEPCPFSPYSDTNLNDISLLEAINSPFFKILDKENMLIGEHNGGCLLFENKDKLELIKKDL